MNENFSLSDVAAAVGNRDDGFGNGGGALWLVIFVIFAFMNGNGFGGNNGALTEAAMCSMNNFAQLENSVGRLADSQNSQNLMLSQAASNLGYQTLEQFGQLSRDLCTGFANGVAATNAAAAQARECCCETQQAILENRYLAAQNTAEINANTTAQTQKILDALCTNRMADMQNRINQLEIQAATAGVVRYPSAFAYSAGANPFCGGSCGCGNI
jgi:hypothetical protein